MLSGVRHLKDNLDAESLRVLQLRLVSVIVLDKEPDRLTTGEKCETVAKCSERVLERLRPLARHMLRGVASLIKGGAPDTDGVLALATRAGPGPAGANLVAPIRNAMLRALVEKKVRKLGNRAWVTQLLSIFVAYLSTREILLLFRDLGRDGDNVLEVSRHDIRVALKRVNHPGVPVPLEILRRQCLNQQRLEQVGRFIEVHRRQVAPSAAASTILKPPLLYVLNCSPMELHAKYVVSRTPSATPSSY